MMMLDILANLRLPDAEERSLEQYIERAQLEERSDADGLIYVCVAANPSQPHHA